MSNSKHFIYGDFDPGVLFDSLSSSIHQGFSVMDRDLNVVMMNRTAMELLEVPLDFLKNDRSLAAILRFNAERGDYGVGDPEELVKVRIDLAKKFVPHDFVRMRPDGAVIRVQGTPMINGGFITIYTDITAEHEQESALKEARDQLEKSLGERTRQLAVHHEMLLNSINAIKDGLTIVDAEGKVVLANNKMFEIYPQLPAFLARQASLSDVIRSVFPDEPDRTLDDLSDVGMWEEREYPNGTWYKITRSRTDEGGMLCVYTDITTYKDQHSILQSHTDELVRHLRKEKELNEMQREFVSMASHEFRTPLAIIDSNAQRILRKIDRVVPEKLAERLGNIRESVERMQYLIDRFLNFSQTQSVGMEIEREPVDLAELVQRVCARYEAITKTRGFDVDVSLLPDAIELDKKLMEQGISNLLSNAIKYSHEGSTITVTGSMAGGEALISVRDEGVGIPSEELPKIFKRYFRASTSSGIAGTGIGLNMTKMILQKHGGKIHVESKVGQGTTITVSVPVLDRQTQRKHARAS